MLMFENEEQLGCSSANICKSTEIILSGQQAHGGVSLFRKNTTTGCPKKVHKFVQVLFNLETRYINKLCLV